MHNLTHLLLISAIVCHWKGGLPSFHHRVEVDHYGEIPADENRKSTTSQHMLLFASTFYCDCIKSMDPFTIMLASFVLFISMGSYKASLVIPGDRRSRRLPIVNASLNSLSFNFLKHWKWMPMSNVTLFDSVLWSVCSVHKIGAIKVWQG